MVADDRRAFGLSVVWLRRGQVSRARPRLRMFHLTKNKKLPLCLLFDMRALNILKIGQTFEVEIIWRSQLNVMIYLFEANLQKDTNCNMWVFFKSRQSRLDICAHCKCGIF